MKLFHCSATFSASQTPINPLRNGEDPCCVPRPAPVWPARSTPFRSAHFGGALNGGPSQCSSVAKLGNAPALELENMFPDDRVRVFASSTPAAARERPRAATRRAFTAAKFSPQSSPKVSPTPYNAVQSAGRGKRRPACSLVQMPARWNLLRGSQNPVVARPWGFESPFRHLKNQAFSVACYPRWVARPSVATHYGPICLRVHFARGT
jgi:hypothetical protein